LHKVLFFHKNILVFIGCLTTFRSCSQVRHQAARGFDIFRRTAAA